MRNTLRELLTRSFSRLLTATLVLLAGLGAVSSCARMGQPDGGWYDELPPRIVDTSPKEGATHVDSRRIVLTFDEYVQLENPQEKVVVSPAQREQPLIKVQGKRIVVQLNDSLQPNTTYTIDFSDAITDLNEGNPMGNYTYTFSTGDVIDSLQVSGYVVDAFTLDPVKGILVGVYAVQQQLTDTARGDLQSPRPSLQRVARTDVDGRFIVKGIAPGTYQAMALNDVDGDLQYSQTAEQVAFDPQSFTPTCSDAQRQDTLWRDSLHIRDIRRTEYIRYQPDDLALRAFTATPDMRALIKTERTEGDRFSLFFSAPDTLKPTIRGLNFDDSGTLLTETSHGNDTITCWLCDSALIRQDTLTIELGYRATDTLGVLQHKADTINVVSKLSFAQRQKNWQKDYDRWQQQQKRKAQRGEPTDERMPSQYLQPKYTILPMMPPDQAIGLLMPTPLAHIDTAAIHLYEQRDSSLIPVDIRLVDLGNRHYELQTQWQQECAYSLVIDSVAFTDIHGQVNKSYKTGIKVPGDDEYCTLTLHLQGWENHRVVAQLLNSQGTVMKETTTTDGEAVFRYLRTGTYFLRAYIDSNANGRWDTGNYRTGLQPELMCYYPKPINCRAKWDINEQWNPMQTPLERQKPKELRKKIQEEKKSMKQRNLDRARKLGIKEIPEKYTAQ